MSKAGIAGMAKRRFRTTTDSDHELTVAPNLLDRQFQPGPIGERWVSDITYIRTLNGWAYLTTILDLGDRRVVGWQVGKTMKAIDTIIPSWEKALANRPIQNKLILHSDRGVQYASHEFRERLKKKVLVVQSMSRKGNCWDNAVAESFFKTIKQEWIDRFRYATIEEVRKSVFEYIETFYNTHRRHSTLGYLSPAEYEQNLISITRAA
jgi:transposase InsO family protein